MLKLNFFTFCLILLLIFGCVETVKYGPVEVLKYRQIPGRDMTVDSGNCMMEAIKSMSPEERSSRHWDGIIEAYHKGCMEAKGYKEVKK